jgi:hypothetical protein
MIFGVFMLSCLGISGANYRAEQSKVSDRRQGRDPTSRMALQTPVMQFHSNTNYPKATTALLYSKE